MEGYFKLGAIRRLAISAILSLVVVFGTCPPEPVHAQQNNVTVQTICGNLNASWPDIASVFANIMAMINNAIQSMAQIGVGVGIGNINSCLPNININLPTLNLQNCFSFGANFNCNLNIQLPNLQQCLNNALQALQGYLNQFNININMQQLLNCLSGLVNINVTIPDVLAIVNSLLNSILGLLNSLTASISWYSDVFHFFVSFCGNNAGGGIGGGGCAGASGGGGLGGGGSFNNSVTGGGGSIGINMNPFGGTSPLTMAQNGGLGNTLAEVGSLASDRYTVIATIRNTKTKKTIKGNINVPCGISSCKKTYKGLNKKYKGKKVEVVTSVYPKGGNASNAFPEAEMYNVVTY